jgi:dihydroorotase-like cyclic amidohydrolase
MSGPSGDGFFRRIAYGKMVRFFSKAIKERIGYFPRGENAAGRHADLALMEPASECRV